MVLIQSSICDEKIKNQQIANWLWMFHWMLWRLYKKIDSKLCVVMLVLLSVYWFLCSPNLINLLLWCLLHDRLGSSNNLMIFCSSLRFVLCPKRPGKGNITSLHTKTSCNCTVLSNTDIFSIQGVLTLCKFH